MSGDRLAPAAGRMAAALGLVAVLGWPIAATAWQAVRGAGAPSGSFALIDAGAFGREASLVAGPAVETLRVSGAAVLGALAIGLPMAVLLSRTDLPGRRLLRAAMALAVFVPMPILVAGWLGGFGGAGYGQLFGREPLLKGWPGAAFVHAVAGVPWVALLSGIGLRAVPPELEESALLDLPAWRVLLGVSLRGAAGAIVGSAVLVAALTAGDMTVTDLLLVRTFAEEAYVQYGLGRPPAAVALVAIPPALTIGLSLLVAGRLVLRVDPARIASASAASREWRLGAWRWPIGLLAWLVSAALFVPPVLAMAWRAGRVGGDAAAGVSPSWSPGGLGASLSYAAAEVRGPLLETAAVAAVGASLSVLLAWGLAWLCRRPGPWRWATLLSASLLLALPGPVAGMALLQAYLPVAPVSDSLAIVALGYVMRTLPFALLVLWPAVRGIPAALLESAEVDGHGPTGRIARVALPMTAGPVGASWLVGFVLATGELPITNLVSPAGTDPLTKFLWGQMHFGVDSRISAVGLVLLAAFAGAGALAVGACRWAYRGSRSG
ncbi:ABC transporter permease [Tautonia sociabilis]|uniref:Iron ABC transporter permease n=1 Tax=Tautonia sociabilis TaxID=2080755 RepID=A0A432MEZ6_9BACT|nr:iron ABC transporter permease [Tautonia sociabilis]RUL84320.1 iron ABC transporter permease [Tautonia sociabilis]